MLKKYSFYIALVGIVLILFSALLLFRNSNKKVDMSRPKSRIDEVSREVDELEVTDKFESTKKYEVVLSEIQLSINELDGTNFEMYKNKDISLFDYYVNNKKIKEYNSKLENLRKKIYEKLK